MWHAMPSYRSIRRCMRQGTPSRLRSPSRRVSPWRQSARCSDTNTSPPHKFMPKSCIQKWNITRRMHNPSFLERAKRLRNTVWTRSDYLHELPRRNSPSQRLPKMGSACLGCIPYIGQTSRKDRPSLLCTIMH